MISLIASRLSFWVSLAGIVTTLFLLIRTSTSQGIPEPLEEPPPKPKTAKVAGSGIVESLGDNTRVSGNVPGVVSEVLVSVGGKVSKGDPLFDLDPRVAESELAIAKSGLEVAKAQYDSLKKVLDRLTRVKDSRAVSTSDLESRRSEVAVAAARVKSAEAEVRRAETAITLLTVLSPSDGSVLQVNVNAGEFNAPGAVPPPVLLGSRDELQVRVDIDEELTASLPDTPAAVGYIRGIGEAGIDLEFIRIEPLIVPKRNLSGLPAERVDTRVLQIIFKPKNPEDNSRLFIGQQLDVFVVPADAS
ncbi:MAG: biotin/lipoyl-binding protein [Verrucomicrobiales bacterium]|nr:biotin/lipoyl-binding protein [Verrucomicrobiales bacterium]